MFHLETCQNYTTIGVGMGKKVNNFDTYLI